MGFSLVDFVARVVMTLLRIIALPINLVYGVYIHAQDVWRCRNLSWEQYRKLRRFRRAFDESADAGMNMPMPSPLDGDLQIQSCNLRYGLVSGEYHLKLCAMQVALKSCHDALIPDEVIEAVRS